jgi:hypothetical protein
MPVYVCERVAIATNLRALTRSNQFKRVVIIQLTILKATDGRIDFGLHTDYCFYAVSVDNIWDVKFNTFLSRNADF